MTVLLQILVLALSCALLVMFFMKRRADRVSAALKKQSEASIVSMRTIFESKVAELDLEAQRIREHYEREAHKVQESAQNQVAIALAELEPLRGYAHLHEAEESVRQTLAAALLEANALRQEAQALVEQTRTAGLEERAAARKRAKELQDQAEAFLAQATREAGRIVADAEKRAEEIGGDAYVALRDKELIENALKAMRNVIEGYGDRYVIPTRSLLDDLAADYGHTEAGLALKTAREHTRVMVEQGEAAACDYAENYRRETAIRFVTDAFNGRVDAILTNVKHDNHGTLEQEIRDAFSLVNYNGQAFRNARIQPAYLDARLAELRWAVTAQELRFKEREEQRRIQEQIREEEKARRDYERAMQEAAREEAAIKQAMEKARLEAAHATAEERAKYEAQLAELTQRLGEAEAKNQRAMSMAQQTRAGHVYIISNVGSFGEEVLKIGVTRRLEPLDRIKELGDASVPFEFDVHAMIYSEDAPTLERLLHEKFEEMRINKVNYRKEFFRVPLERIRAIATEQGLNVTFTMAAAAREYRETVALDKMTPEQRERFYRGEISLDSVSAG
jgi:hypothetical protein